MSYFLNKTWVFRTEAEDGAKDRTGGALCISRNGLLITVAHNLEIPGFNREDCTFVARTSNDKELRELRLITESRNFDLALLEVKKVKEGENFDYYSLEEDGVEVDINQNAIAFLHQNYHLFTKKHGITCYPFPKNVSREFPDVQDETILKLAGFPDIDTMTDQKYRTLDYVVDRLDEQFMDLHPKLPLVQVAGFDDEPGSSGCPIFRLHDHKLLGLVCISKDNFLYLLPLDLLKAFVSRHVEQLDNSWDLHVRQDSSSEPESESE